MLNEIGLDNLYAQQVSKKLNQLLSEYSIYYMNLRGFHWNIKGEKFYELHLKFEEFYTDAQLKIDEIAERILSLRHVPIHSYSEYLKLSTIAEVNQCSDATTAVEHILSSLKTLLILERQILEESSQANDEGTNALMSDYIREQEKNVWMLSAYLSK